MIRGFLLLVVVASMVMAQRSPYLSSDPSYPKLLNRFKPATSASSGIGDKLGGAAAPTEQTWPAPQGGAGGSLYDQETINRVASWPEDKQPFWFKNMKHIAQHTGNQLQQNSTA